MSMPRELIFIASHFRPLLPFTCIKLKGRFSQDGGHSAAQNFKAHGKKMNLASFNIHHIIYPAG